MSWRSDSSELFAGKWTSSLYAGLGIQAQNIPATGDNGAGYLYNDIAAQGAAATDEMRGQILTTPAAGTFTHYEDSSFSFTGAPDGVYTFTYRGFRNGVSYGDYTVTMTIGSPSGATVNAIFPSFTVGVAASSAAPNNNSSVSVNATFSKFSASALASFNAPDSSAIVSAAFPKFTAFVIAGPKSLSVTASISASFPAFSASTTGCHNSQRLYGDIGTMPWQLAIANKRFIN